MRSGLCDNGINRNKRTPGCLNVNRDSGRLEYERANKDHVFYVVNHTKGLLSSGGSFVLGIPTNEWKKEVIVMGPQSKVKFSIEP